MDIDISLYKYYWAAWDDVIFKYINSYIHDVGISEQLCQDIFFKLTAKISENPNASRKYIKHWLFRCAKNAVNNYVKLSANNYEILHGDLTCTDIANVNAAGFYKDSHKDFLYEKLDELEEIERKIITYRINEYSCSEIAQYLNKSRHAVYCIYSKAVKKLKLMAEDEI